MRKLEAIKTKNLQTGDVIQLGNYYTGFTTARIEKVEQSKNNSRLLDVTMTTLSGKWSNATSVAFYGNEARFFKVVA